VKGDYLCKDDYDEAVVGELPVLVLPRGIFRTEVWTWDREREKET